MPKPAVIIARPPTFCAALRESIASYLDKNKATLALRGGAASDLVLSLHEPLDRRFFVHAGRRLEAVLKHSRGRLTLRVDSLQLPQLEHLQLLLRRLARYGDRIFIVADERLRGHVMMDSSVFNLVLVQSAEQTRI